jgi:L-ribulose-5-phosphate 3-epimerase
VQIGMLGRFFPGNWRPPADEIRFAAQNGFSAVQIRNDSPGGIAAHLRADLTELGRLFVECRIEPVLEMLAFHDGAPDAILRALRANLDAIRQIGIRRVHVHPVGPETAAPLLANDFAAALALAQPAGLMFGVEHNAPGHRLLVTAESVHALLRAVPGLCFVWDLNHTRSEEVASFAALRDRLSLVHASDTPLPETNHHLPIGRGSVDFSVLRGVDVPVILEVGGLAISGGPGLDTDETLIDSKRCLTQVVSDPS